MITSPYLRVHRCCKGRRKHLADQYKSAMDKVTGAEMTRNMEEVQSEMEVVYSAIVMRLITLEETVEVLQRKNDSA